MSYREAGARRIPSGDRNVDWDGDTVRKRTLAHHCLVVVLEVDPPPEPGDDRLPLGAVPRDNPTALGVVLVDAHGKDVVAALDAELLVDLKLYG